MSKKIVAIVIWFNPESKMLENIFSYSKLVTKTIILDNSDNNNYSLIENTKNTENTENIEYIPLMSNLGVASALNIGFNRAEELGAEWVLTMDQDSAFWGDNCIHYLSDNARHFNELNVAVFGPNFDGQTGNYLTDCDSVITSGSLVNLEAYKKNFGFNESLFIDQVDHEFCFRLKLLGYRILKVGYIEMNHVIGSPITKKLFGRIFKSYNHNYIRKYYITRNTLYMRRHFSDFGNKHLKLIIMDLINIIFVEDDKYRKVMSMIKGCFDFFAARMGPIDAVLYTDSACKLKSSRKGC